MGIGHEAMTHERDDFGVASGKAFPGGNTAPGDCHPAKDLGSVARAIYRAKSALTRGMRLAMAEGTRGNTNEATQLAAAHQEERRGDNDRAAQRLPPRTGAAATPAASARLSFGNLSCGNGGLGPGVPHAERRQRHLDSEYAEPEASAALLPMKRAGVYLLAFICCMHCQGADVAQTERRSAMPERSGSIAVPHGDSGVDAASGEDSFPNSAWCSRLGPTDNQALLTVRDIVFAYMAAQQADCRTAALTASQTDPEYCSWVAYLTSYTLLMAGCQPNFETVTGGIDAFGPANTPYTGASREKLTRAEAEALATYYLNAFATVLALSPGEQEAVRAHLARTAQSEIDLTAGPSLSTCQSPDAGSSQ